MNFLPWLFDSSNTFTLEHLLLLHLCESIQSHRNQNPSSTSITTATNKTPRRRTGQKAHNRGLCSGLAAPSSNNDGAESVFRETEGGEREGDRGRQIEGVRERDTENER